MHARDAADARARTHPAHVPPAPTNHRSDIDYMNAYRDFTLDDQAYAQSKLRARARARPCRACVRAVCIGRSGCMWRAACPFAAFDPLHPPISPASQTQALVDQLHANGQHWCAPRPLTARSRAPTVTLPACVKPRACAPKHQTRPPRSHAAAPAHRVPILDPGIKIDSRYDAYRRGIAAGVFIRDASDGQPYVGQARDI